MILAELYWQNGKLLPVQPCERGVFCRAGLCAGKEALGTIDLDLLRIHSETFQVSLG